MDILSRAQPRNGTNVDADCIMKVHLCCHDKDKEWLKEIENDPKTMWLYAKNEDKDSKNIEKLAECSKK